jgi:Sulfotransferase domain
LLAQDLRSAVTRTATFLNKKLTEEGMEAILDHLSFQSMKNNPAVNLEPVLEYRKTTMTQEQSPSLPHESRDGQEVRRLERRASRGHRTHLRRLSTQNARSSL